MKNISLFLCLLYSWLSLFGQIDYNMNINNKGNRLQTYPRVTATDPEVVDMVNQVSIPNLESAIRWMQDLGCRDAQSEEALQTQNWLVTQFENLGLETYLHFFFCGDSYLGYCTNQLCAGEQLEAGNVIAIQYGTTFPDEFIIVSSHYDHPDGPGADDNASGTAAVLETARILSQYSFDRSIIYAPFNGEEYWMVGSMPYAQKCAIEEMNILGVFNYDMIGYFPEMMGNITMYSGFSPISERLFNYYQTVANLYVPLVHTYRFSDGDSYGGDQMSFNIYEYPALYIGDIEYYHIHPCYHQQCDTIGNGVNNFDLAKAFVQAVTAAVAELANGYLPPQNFSAIPAANRISLSWDPAPNTALYRIYKNETLLVETTENQYIDYAVSENVQYKYYVKAVRAGDNFESANSNEDHAKLSEPLTLPHQNEFESEEDLAFFYFPYDSWLLHNVYPYTGQSSMISTTTSSLPDNYLTIAELQWFSIPDTVDNISIKFYFHGKIQGMWHNANLFIEVTTDRKKWDKILKIPQTIPYWEQYAISLNDYIGKPFVQIRFRLESSGTNAYLFPKQVSFDHLSIDFTAASSISNPLHSLPFENIQVYPNPSNGHFTIETGSEKSYHLSVYDVIGKQVFQDPYFQDGTLNLNHLKPGIYFLKISIEKNNIAKKIVIQ